MRLQALTQGNDKNNFFGLGAAVEVKAGDAYQFREADGGVVHFGLGEIAAPDLLRVVWTNGVPQNRLAPKRDQLVVEEQVLKGSCPFLYVETGDGVEFVTDLLWGAPLGMPVAEGVWAGWDPAELVRVDGAAVVRGVYDLRITEELWEAAFFDLAKLWVVDHPARRRGGVEPARAARRDTSTERVLAAAEVTAGRGGVGRPRARRHRRAWRVATRSTPTATQRGSAQGVAAEPWTFTFDLGEAPGGAGAPAARRLDLPRRREPQPRGRAAERAARRDAARDGDRGRLAAAPRAHGLSAGQDQDDGGRHAAAARRACVACAS